MVWEMGVQDTCGSEGTHFQGQRGLQGWEHSGGQRVSLSSAFFQSMSRLCHFSQSWPRMTLWEWDLPSRKWIHSQCSPNTTSKSIPYQILPSLFCNPSTLYIVIEFCRGDGSSPTHLTHSKSMKQLVQPESMRAFVVAPLPVLRASKCTWMASSCGTHFGVSFLGISLLAVSTSTLSFSSAPIQICLCCKIVYLGDTCCRYRDG